MPSDGTKIEWADAPWNPITGCAIVSSGCVNCYAMNLAAGRLRHHPSRAGLTEVNSNLKVVWNGKVRFNESVLDQPLHWRRPRRIFVCAHGDLFHLNVPKNWIDAVFSVAAEAHQHQFLVLTKRAERLEHYFRCTPPQVWPLPNVWIGVSVEDQRSADFRVPRLMTVRAAVRWVSVEPLLGWVDLKRLAQDEIFPVNALTGRLGGIVNGYNERPLDWVVVGGETGPGARYCHHGDIRKIVDDCRGSNVPVFVKQLGSCSSWSLPRGNRGNNPADWPFELRVRQYPTLW
mgnify:CR=1 FL=1